ncbi:MAG: hypothetical protein AB1941_01845 [Gemmatimonadota bacterium]
MITHLTQDEHREGIYYSTRGEVYRRLQNGRGETTGFLRVFPGKEPGQFFTVPGASRLATLAEETR